MTYEKFWEEFNGDSERKLWAEVSESKLHLPKFKGQYIRKEPSFVFDDDHLGQLINNINRQFAMKMDAYLQEKWPLVAPGEGLCVHSFTSLNDEDLDKMIFKAQLHVNSHILKVDEPVCTQRIVSGQSVLIYRK